MPGKLVSPQTTHTNPELSFPLNLGGHLRAFQALQDIGRSAVSLSQNALHFGIILRGCQQILYALSLIFGITSL